MIINVGNISYERCSNLCFLYKSSEILTQIFRKEPTVRPLVLMVTDGKANAGLGDTPPHKEELRMASTMPGRFDNARFIVIDTEPPGVVRFNLAQDLAAVLNADYFHPESLCAEDLGMS